MLQQRISVKPRVCFRFRLTLRALKWLQASFIASCRSVSATHSTATQFLSSTIFIVYNIPNVSRLRELECATREDLPLLIVSYVLHVVALVFRWRMSLSQYLHFKPENGSPR